MHRNLSLNESGAEERRPGTQLLSTIFTRFLCEKIILVFVVDVAEGSSLPAAFSVRPSAEGNVEAPVHTDGDGQEADRCVITQFLASNTRRFRDFIHPL